MIIPIRFTYKGKRYCAKPWLQKLCDIIIVLLFIMIASIDDIKF